MNAGREVLVGGAIILGVIAVVVGTLWMKEADIGRSTVQIEAHFEQAGQLLEGNAVKFRGVNVGRVESISVSESGEFVVIGMRIREDVALPEDAGVLLSPESLFGDWQAEIVSRSQMPRYDFLQARGDALPGHTLPDISRLTAAADEIAQNLTVISDRFETAFTEETAQNIARAIDNMQAVSEDLQNLVTQLAGTFNEVAAEVRVAAEDIGSAAGAAEATFAGIDRRLAGGDIDSILVAARMSVQNLRSTTEGLEEGAAGLGETLARADSTFAVVERLAGRIERGEGALGRLLVDSTLAVQAEGALTELNALLADIRENPRRYLNFSVF